MSAVTDIRALTLYVIRHGECEHNAAGWAAGHDDSPLTELGRAQARANGRVLRGVAPRLDNLDFFASSLHRACRTMELLRDEIGLPATDYRADRRLMEIDLGNLTRAPGNALRMAQQQVHQVDSWHHAHPNGESPAAVYARVGHFLESLARDAVIVTHGIPLIAIRAHYLGLSGEQAMGYHMGNAGVLRLSQGTEALFGK